MKTGSPRFAPIAASRFLMLGDARSIAKAALCGPGNSNGCSLQAAARAGRIQAGANKVLRRVIMSRRYAKPACRATSKIQGGSRAVCLELKQNPKRLQNNLLTNLSTTRP
jgi:hypothetical protein